MGSPRPLPGQGPVSGGAWAVADQALYAGANFALNVALARALAPDEYGAFATAFVTFLLLGAIHGGLLVEPVLVFGAGRFAHRRAAYLRWAVASHARLSVAIAALLVAAGGLAWLAGWPMLALALVGFAVAQAGILLHWLLRRACHLAGRTDLAAFSCLGYLVCLVVGMVVLGQVLGALTAALLMGACSLMMAAGLAGALGVLRSRTDRRLALAATAAHGRYGRYSVWTGVLEWAQGALPFVVVPAVAGLGEAAHLRAAFNLAMPALQAGAAITVMMVPALVSAHDPGAVARRTGRALIVAAAVYGLAIGVSGDAVMALLYAGAYEAAPAVRWSLAALPVLSVMAGTLVAVLRSRENPRAVLVSRGLAAACGAPILVVLTARAGVAGALTGACLILALEAALLARGLGQRTAHPASADGRPQGMPARTTRHLELEGALAP